MTLIWEFLIWSRDNLLRAVSLAVVGLIAYAGYQAINNFFPIFASSYSSQHADLTRAIASYAKLDAILNRLKTEYHASRAVLFRFHDSSKDASQMAFYFVSVANIVGAAADQESIRDLPASTYTPVLATLVKKQIWFAWQKELPDGPLKDLLAKRGDQAVLYAPMPDLDGNLIGILSLEWLSAPDVPQITDDMKASLQSNATLISGYFSLAQLKDAP